MSEPLKERRRADRLAHDNQLLVKVIGSESPNLAVGRLVSCRVCDVSLTGLRLRSDAEIPAGTLLETWIIASHRLGTLVLRGTVTWCRPAETPGAFFVGLEIDPKTSAEYKDWPEMVKEIVTRARQSPDLPRS